MRKPDKQFYRMVWPYIFFAVSMLLMAAALSGGKYMYGSLIDWNSQHTVIPDYFRQTFYSTGDIFQSFAGNLGAGQNIYNFAYYGYLSPIILFSYLLPFVSMKAYISAASLCSVICSVMMMYGWLSKKFSFRAAFLASLMFEFAAPLMFYSHRHIMFVIYLPFLLLAVFGAEKYLEKGKCLQMVIGVFLLIMSSYYFSVSAIIALSLYTVAAYIKMNADMQKKITLNAFLSKAAGFVLRIIAAVMMAAILILPVMETLISNRRQTNTAYSLKELLVPNISGSLSLYTISSMGLTAVFIVAVIYGIMSRKGWLRFIAAVFAVLCTMRIFVYLLNGGMYVDGKVLIPFLPMAGILMAAFFESMFARELDYRKLLAVTAVISAVIILFTSERWCRIMFAADMSYTMLILGLWNYKKIKEGMVFTLAVIAAGVSVYCGYSDVLVPVSSSAKTVARAEKYLSEKIEADDGSMYRIADLCATGSNVNRIQDAGYMTYSSYSSISNALFSDFYCDSLFNEQYSRNDMNCKQTRSLLFDMFMGDKYLLTKDGHDPGMSGYYKKYSHKCVAVWENKYAYPLAYALPDTISAAEYAGLDKADKAAALLTCAVTGTDASAANGTVGKNSDGKAALLHNSRIGGSFDFGKNTDAVKLSGTKYRLDIKQKTAAGIELDKTCAGKVLLISLHVDNGKKSGTSSHYLKQSKKRDTTITINGIKNKLSDPGWKYCNNNHDFEYALSINKPVKRLSVTLGSGKYTVSDLKIYAIDNRRIRSARTKIDVLKPSSVSGSRSVKSSGPGTQTVFNGSIKAKQDEYFVTTIPYDDHFIFYVDGRKTKYYQTDTAFMGFPISSGQHKITAVYHNGTADKGAAVSLAGLLLLVAIDIFQRKHQGNTGRTGGSV